MANEKHTSEHTNGNGSGSEGKECKLLKKNMTNHKAKNGGLENKKPSKLTLYEQETIISFNEGEPTLHVFTSSNVKKKYFKKMGFISDYDLVNPVEFTLESKHQLILKVEPAKQCRCSKKSCTF